ncbi:Transposition protein, TnsC-related protein [Pseudomonas amygdali pv. myricae]|uniref:transposase n=1 Tax=Pseudomonas amygdali TaxID=47877 RepID=UPI000EFFDBE3|nr:transposase [Pseudomonas amygdali]RMV27755.1 Transposition protein, TnsC-related protein [Pseudomonas amygdali pv. myricae]
MTDIFSARFDGLDTLADIRRLITAQPDPVTGLEDLSPALAAERLSEVLKTIFLPNQFSLDFIKDCVDRARSFSTESFSSDQQYQRRLYHPPENEAFPICLTGLAGVGKSQTISALMKVMPGPALYTSAHYHEPHNLVSYWYASARGKAGGRQLLEDFLGGDATGVRANTSKLLTECRRRVNRDGVSLMVLEEMQHQTTGQGVVRVTDILLTMAGLGVPMIYVANYSLGHKLLTRNSEDKQRLLSEPRVMLPDHPDSKAWKDYVLECIRVSGRRVSADPSALVHELYRWTFGIKRLAVQLIKVAYLEARAARRHTITLEDVNKAYLSAAYSSSRDDVEELIRLSVHKNKTRVRPDLRCPFPVPMPSNVLSFAKDDRALRVSEKVFVSSLTAEERKTFEQLHPPGSPSNLPSKPKREKKPALPAQTREGLEDAYSRLLSESKGLPKPRGPAK